MSLRLLFKVSLFPPFSLHLAFFMVKVALPVTASLPCANLNLGFLHLGLHNCISLLLLLSILHVSLPASALDCSLAISLYISRAAFCASMLVSLSCPDLGFLLPLLQKSLVTSLMKSFSTSVYALNMSHFKSHEATVREQHPVDASTRWSRRESNHPRKT